MSETKSQPISSGNAPARPRILYVDDQPGNLVVLKSSVKKYIDVVTANSGSEGLALLAKEEFPVVISDQKMHEMSGTQFLSEVRKQYPDTARMLLTAYTNFDDAVAAINEGQVMRFIHKPWERDDLVSALLNAAELYNKRKEN